MDLQRFARVKELLLEARALPRPQRVEFLSKACEGDDSLRHEVESLLAQEEAGASILEPGGLAQRVGSDLATALESDTLPEGMGPYQVLEVLGEGGMGVVYKARQSGPIERDVALKLIKWGMDTARVVARFEAERQTLASLDHPNIAKVLDAGADGRGRPYFVMELVQGQDITDFADEHRLTVLQRLELFLEVCRAVQHAHQRGVIHRDIKPSNILVSQGDGQWLVKVIDFGIAKAIDEPVAGATMTQAGQFIGTPQYMSPEQAGLVKGGVDTRTDVYSLGVLLYELLTGHQPLHFGTGSQLEMLRILETAEPRRPSLAVTREEELTDEAGRVRRTITPAAVSAARSTTVSRLKRDLAGDLENIIQMAMRKEPDGRYASVEQLAEDIGRHLGGLPVRARKDTFGYRAGKFVRRNVVGVGVGATAVLAIAAFVVLLSVQSARIARERDRAVAAEEEATRKAETARRTTEFMVGIFEVSDPGEAQGSTVTAREILDRGAQRIRDELGEEPEVRASLMDAIGRVYQSLGLLASADTLLQDALETRRRFLGPEHLSTAESMANLAFVLHDLGRYEEAEPLYRRALALRRAGLDEADEVVTSSRFALASLLQEQGDLDEAEAEFKKILEIERRTLGNEHPYVAMDLNNLASIYSRKDDLVQAEEFYRESLAINLKVGGPLHPETATNFANLSSILFRQGQGDSALVYSQRALDIRRKVLGEEHPHVAISLNILAGHLDAAGRLEEAEAAYRESVAMKRRTQGERHPSVAHSLMVLGSFLSKHGRHGEAIVVLQEALGVQRESLPPGNPDVARSLYELGNVYLRQGSPELAEPFLREALTVRSEGLPPGHRELLASQVVLGECCRRLGELKEAEPLLLAGLEGLSDKLGSDHSLAQRARQQLVALYEAQGDEERARLYR